MTTAPSDPAAIIARLERQLARERRAREEAEAIAERTTRTLYEQVQALEQAQRDLLAAKDAAETASRATSAFLANMSHEIRTPLNAILGLAYVVLRLPIDGRARKHVSDLYEAGQHLLGILSNVLDLSKLDAGKLVLERVDFSLDDVLERVSTLVASDAQAKGLELVFTGDPDVPRALRGDPLRLAQMLLNYVSNAVKFTDHGTVTVHTALLGADAEGALVRFSVTDTGIGLDDAQLAGLFQDFVQADASTTRRHGGTGLGLAIVRRLAVAMGGEAGATSERGVGSTFWFSVRLDRALASPRALPDLRGRHVLVVDDHEAAREALRVMLEAHALRADVVASGEDALAAVVRAARREDPYDVVLLDWRMPGLDGVATARALRNALEPDHSPEVLMVTAHARDEALAAADAAGIRTVLTKPVTESTLFDALGAVLALGDPDPDGRTLPPGPDEAPSDVAAALAGARVLVVDDAPLNREIARALLETMGVEVASADDGLEAVDLARRERFDLVLMDMQMPVMDGISAALEIRKLPGAAGRVPIAALTANVLDRDRERCLAAGMQAVITKPVDPPKLYAVAAALLAGAPRGRSTEDAPPSAPNARAQPTFDLATALTNTGDDRALLARLIARFEAQHLGEAAAIARDLEAGALRDATRRAHTLKGLAATLGMEVLERRARAVEAALQQGAEPTACARLLEETERALRDAVAAAREALLRG